MVDVDSEEALQRLKATDRDLPSTTTCRTGRGWHYYYKVGEQDLTQRSIEDGVDVRVGGLGYVIVPPSIHPETGRSYIWQVNPRNECEAPGWLVEALAANENVLGLDTPSVLAGVEEGRRNRDLFRLASKCRRTDLPFDSALLIVLDAAQKCDPPLPLGEATRCVESAYSRYKPEPVTSGLVVRMADVQPVRTQFLFEPYVPIGKLTGLVGDPGQGKSFVVAAMATALSKGESLPGCSSSETPLRTLIFTAEDGLADTLRPRLDEMGADVECIFAYPEPVDLSSESGIEFVREKVQDLGPTLLAIDPIVAYVGAGTDTYRANQVRAINSQLARLAEEKGCTILSVVHLNKGRGGNPLHRVQGSVDFVAAARSVLLVGSDPNQPRSRALIHVKSNVGPLGRSIGFEIDEGRFLWTGTSTLTSEDVLDGPLDSEARSKLDEAEDFLRSELGKCRLAVKNLISEARSQGISETTLRRAKKNIGVSQEKTGMEGGWVWKLPDTS